MARNGVILCLFEAPSQDTRKDLEVGLEKRELPFVLDSGGVLLPQFGRIHQKRVPHGLWQLALLDNLSDDVAEVLPEGVPAGQVHQVADAIAARGRVPVRAEQTGFDVFISDWFIEHGVVCFCEHLLHLFQEFVLGFWVQ